VQLRKAGRSWGLHALYAARLLCLSLLQRGHQGLCLHCIVGWCVGAEQGMKYGHCTCHPSERFYCESTS
jgi:hypothetical protein